MTPEFATPALLPLRRDADRVGLARLDEAGYAAASFLDERLLADGASLEWRSWADLATGRSAAVRAHFVFHIGHCGSTLLARLLGEHPALFVLREPALLRELAQGRGLAEAHALLALYARTWRSSQTAVIKATSFVAEIAPELMGLTEGRILLLSSAPAVYLRTILAGDGSRQETQSMAPLRLQRLSARLGRPVQVEGEGEVIAMNWLCGVMALQAAAQTCPGRELWMDFDRLLGAPIEGLAQALAHLGADPAAIDLGALTAGPIMGRYSKGPEHDYDADLRRRLLEQAERQDGVEVRRGMDWLQTVADVHPDVRAALSRVAAASRGSLPPAPSSP